jgi:hypothetical protein
MRKGCLGCLGVVALILLVLLVASGLAYFTARPVRLEDRLLTPRIPAETAGDRPAGGRVVLTIQEAELRIEPVGPGEPLRVEGRYDVNAFALEGDLDPGAGDDGAWVYHATFGRAEGAGAFSGLVSLVRGTTARIRVFLPEDVPLDIQLGMKQGGAVVRLAGLWLRTAEVDLNSGALDLSVAEPLREPMESFTIRTANGACLLNGLGNASPRLLDVSYRMGGIEMDLGGRWLADAEINISGGDGGGVVHLPSGVILEGLNRRSIEPPIAPELKPPTLSFSVTTGRGWLEYSDIHLRGR